MSFASHMLHGLRSTVTIRALPPALSRVLIIVTGLSALAGCKAEESVTRYKPFFTGLSGVTYSTPPVDPSRGYADPTAAPPQGSIIEHPDGTRTLLCKSVRALMSHLERELDEDNTDIIVKQLLSTRTLAEYESRGETPAAIVAHLREHRRDIAMLFARMPMAERSPTVILRQPGGGVWVLELTGAAAKDTRFRKLWVVMERGEWKFYWVT